MNILTKILYKLFKLEPEVCVTCEVLRHELEMMRVENQRLLISLLDKPTIRAEVEPKLTETEPIRRGKFIPNRVRQQFVEQEDRKTLNLMLEFKKKAQSAGVQIPKEVITAKTTNQELENQILGELGKDEGVKDAIG